MDNYITRKDFEGIVTRLDEITKKLSAQEKKPTEVWLDNSELLFLLKISRRTLQSYRDNNMIAYSIIGNKLYYKMSDIEDLLNRHYRKRLS